MHRRIKRPFRITIQFNYEIFMIVVVVVVVVVITWTLH